MKNVFYDINELLDWTNCYLLEEVREFLLELPTNKLKDLKVYCNGKGEELLDFAEQFFKIRHTKYANYRSCDLTLDDIAGMVDKAFCELEEAYLPF